MNPKILELIAKGVDQASGPLGKVSGAVGGLGKAAGAVASGGLALAAAGIAGLAAGAVVAGKAVWEFSQDTDEAMKLFSAQTGIAGTELDEFKEIAKDVWKEGFGDNIGDVVSDMSLVKRAFGETGAELEASTKRAMTLADVFGIDVAESTMVASSMMASWGISSEEAFDIMAAGSQQGLNRMGDLADTLHEYSGDFDRLGFTADQTLSIMNAGLEAGAYNTDVVADGFREMGIRLMEGGEDMSGVFDTMGMDFETMQASIAAGDETWGDYTQTIVQGLLDMDDEVERNAAGAAIFGSKWEDVGGEVFLAAGMATEGIDGIAGSTDDAAKTMATGIMPALERLKRSAIENLAPLGDKAGEVLNQMTPFLEKATEWLGEKIPIAIDWLDEKWTVFWPKAQEGLVGFWTTIKPGLIWVRDTFQQYTAEYLPRLGEAWNTLKEGFGPIVDIWNNNLSPAFAELKDALGLAEDKTSDMAGGLGILQGEFLKLAARGLIDGITAGVQLLTIAFIAGKDAANWFKEKIDNVKVGLDAIKGVIQFVRNRIWELRDAFNNLSLPDWLTPGSPTPLELGLMGINKALVEMPSLTATFGAPSSGSPLGATGGAVIHNHFGRDSVRDDQDILDIADAIADALTIRGLQPAF